MRIWAFIVVFANFLSLRGECAGCGQDGFAKIFEEYQSLTDERIKMRCTYNLLLVDPNASSEALKTNEDRTIECNEKMGKVREKARNYLTMRNEACTRLQATPPCADGSEQAICLAGAGNVSASAQKSEADLETALRELQEEAEGLTKWHRLSTDTFKEQLALIRNMSPQEKEATEDPRKGDGKSTVSRSGDRNNKSSPTSVNGGQGQRGANGNKRGPGNDSSISSAERPPAGDGRDSRVNATGGGARGIREIRPSEAGVRTLREYEMRLPYLIRESQSERKATEEFRNTASVRRMEHGRAASQLAVAAAKLFMRAEEMGYAGEELPKWKKENPRAVSEARAQMHRLIEVPGELEGGSTATEVKSALLFTKTEKAESQAELDSAIDSANAEKESVEAALDSFESNLHSEESKGPKAAAERTRLKDLLRLRLQQGGEASSEDASPGGGVVGDILLEAKEVLARSLASEQSGSGSMGALDVESALRDIEGQLKEMDRQAGILDSESFTLFERVKSRLKRAEKAWAKRGR